MLADFGLELPKDVEVRVHDSTADQRYIMLAMRPKATRGWTEAELARLVRRDCMIGTAIVAAPSKPASRRRTAR